MAKNGKWKPHAAQSKNVRQKRNTSRSMATTENPFDAKFNREKESVLGKRSVKTLHGKPGIAKKKMVDKRMKTLLAEYHSTRRSGMFEDTSLGENDSKLSADEKMFLRYAAERKKSYEKKISTAEFDLGDDEELPRREHGSKRSAEHSYGGMSEQAVAEVHFGKGGEDNARNDWRDRLDQLIADSKQAKYEKHAERYHTNDLVDELDEDWSTLRGAIFAAGAPLPPEAPKLPTADDQQADVFDKAVKELRFEQCPNHHKIVEAQQASAASDRKRRLFEEETEAKMNVVFATQDKDLPVHISADALDEDIAAITKQFSRKKRASTKDSTPNVEDVKLRIRDADIDMTSLGVNILKALQQLHAKFNPELHPGNKEKFVSHFVRYLKHIFGAAESEEQPPVHSVLSDLNDAIRLLFDFVRTYISFAETAFRSNISSHMRVFCQPVEAPSPDQIGRCYCLLKVIAAIFPTSDAFHPVSTPAFALLAAALRALAITVSSPAFKASSDPLGFICLIMAFIDLGISFVSRSRRYFPEIIICFVHTFDALLTLKNSLGLLENNEKCPFNKLPCHHTIEQFFDRILTIANTICNLWADLSGSSVFFEDIVRCLHKLENNLKVNDVLESFAKCISKPLVPLKAKAKPAEEVVQLPSFLPLVPTKKASKAKKESAAAKTTHLKRQIRKEHRHAVRELRRDNEFLARQSLTERLAEDEERERKTKRIIGQLAEQEGEFRKFNKSS